MNTTPTALEACIEELRLVRYEEAELAEIRAFLEKFCDVAIIFLSRLFERAKIYKKAPPFEQVS